MCTSLAEYLRARCQLEDEYCQRLNSLGQDISIARYRREQVHADSELVRPFLTIFNVITEAAEVVSNEHAARAREIREQAYEACSDTVKHQQEQLRSITSDIKAWKTRLRHANIELENSQTLYIKAKQKAAETQAQAARSTGGARAQDQADAAEAELASVKEAYVHQLAGANSLHREFYAEGGKTTELLGRLEQMATAAPSSICSPAQVLAAGDGVSQQVVDTFPKVCRRGCVGDLHEYIIRNATGRPRPVDIAFESYDELFIGSHTVRLVSLEPLRTWEVDLNNRRVTLRGAGEELVFGAHKIVELGRAARSRVEAVLGIEGLLQGEELKGGGLSRAARQGSKAGGGTAESSAADSQGISRLDLRFPSPAWRELFINALQSVRRQSAADDCPPCDDAVDWTPPAWTTALCPNEDATVCLDSLTTWVGSINLGSTAELPERLQGWMPKDLYALYVVGVANGEMTENDLSQQLQRHLGPGHVRIAAKSLAFLRIFAFIRAPMRPYVSSVECGVVSVLKTMRQCGGAAIALRYHETAFAFICLWIPPDERKQQTAKDRCTRVNDIIGDLKNAFKLWPDKGLSLCSQYVHTVVFGETNFRIDMPQHTISTLAAESAWEEIYLADQLRISREAGAVLAEFTEAEPPYPPTVLDDAGGMWESRVLWSSHPNHFSKLLSLNRADLAKVAGRFVPVSAVLQFQISRCTMDRLGSLKSLDLQGCEMQVSELRVTDLAPPTGGFTSFSSDKRTSDAYVTFAGAYFEQPQDRTSTQLKTANPSWDKETIVLRSFMPDGLPIRLSALVLTVRHQARIVGSDPILGEVAIGLHALQGAAPAVGAAGTGAAALASERTHFSAFLAKDGRRTGRIEGYIRLH